MRSYTSLAELPAELYEAILDQIHPSELQKSTLALCLAVPRAPVPRRHLYKHVLITSRPQILRLWRKLELSKKKDGEQTVARWVKSFCLNTFDVDADMLYNTILLIPRIQYLHLNIGTTFGPEHLDDLFRRSQPHLSLLSLRFRPYVEKVTYYQFLKGQYSDILVENITKWPANPSFTHLSMVQDPLPASSFDPQTSFAQPIVFFSLEVFRPFSLSSLAQSITHLRIRVPSRPKLVQLLEPGAFPSLKALDISTSVLGHPERSLPLLLAQHQNLEHLILDSCTLSRERWRDLSRACALAGQSKSRAREKRVNAWLERSSRVHIDPAGDGVSVSGVDRFVAPNPTQTRTARHGRRGVAAATFSLRTAPNSRLVSSETSADRSGSNGNSASAVISRKIRILPPLPSLLTFSTTFTPPPDAQKANDWRTEFEAGWRSGIETLLSARARLRTAASAGVAGVRLMRFDRSLESSQASQGSDIEESFHNLVDVGLDATDIWEAECGIPVICFGDTCRLSSDDIDRAHDPEDKLDLQHQIFLANGEQDMASGTFIHGDGNAGRKMHGAECGHELHDRVWDFYERVAENP